jgi:hypothetical protein
MAKQLPVGSLCWYRDHDGSAKKVYIAEVNREVIPPKYYITIDGRKRESESLRLTLISPPQQKSAPAAEKAPQQHAQALPAAAGHQAPSQPAAVATFPAGANAQWAQPQPQAAPGGHDAGQMNQQWQPGGLQNGLQQQPQQYGHNMPGHQHAGQPQQPAPHPAQPYGAQMPNQNASWGNEYQTHTQQPQQQYSNHMAPPVNADLQSAPNMPVPQGMSTPLHNQQGGHMQTAGYQVRTEWHR